MSRFSRIRRRRDERGMTTSEYAVGTVGACGVAGIIVKLVQSEWFTDFLTGFFDKIPDFLPF